MPAFCSSVQHFSRDRMELFEFTYFQHFRCHRNLILELELSEQKFKFLSMRVIKPTNGDVDRNSQPMEFEQGAEVQNKREQKLKKEMKRAHRIVKMARVRLDANG
jgi:hypothetical protein